MGTSILNETFDKQLDKRLAWFNAPRDWFLQNESLVIRPAAQTDFWQRTHYGFQNDNGHFLYTEIDGDFTLTTKVQFSPAHQYDQAGLMVRISPDYWIKTSLEFETEEPDRLGAVVTRHGFSDWSTQDVTQNIRELQFRIQRQKNDYIIAYRLSETNPWSQIRVAHLENPAQLPVQCGLYACSPIEAGYEARFEYLKIDA